MQTQEMRSENRPPRTDEAEEYLAKLQSLAGELDRAMNAIAHQELSVLRGSLECQQTTCAELVHLRSRAGLAQDSQDLQGPVYADLAGEIQKAQDTLVTLNRQYSALLKHSGESLRLLSGLFRSYIGSDRASSGLQTNLRTWSCQV